MDDPARVCVIECVRDLAQEPPHLLDGQTGFMSEQGGQVPTRQHGHDEVGETIAFADVIDRDDVGVGELRRGLCLTSEAGTDRGIVRQLGRKHLDGDGPVQAQVARAVDHRHAATPDFPLEGVLRPDRLYHAILERRFAALFGVSALCHSTVRLRACRRIVSRHCLTPRQGWPAGTRPASVT